MRQILQTSRSRDLLAVLLLPAWLASACDNDSIRLGGWAASGGGASPTPAPPAGAPPLATPTPPPAPAPVPGPTGMPEGETPLAVNALLRARCSQCHQYGQRDPSGWGSVMDLSRMIDSQIVMPGNIEGSRMWHRVAIKNNMPFNGTRFTPEEKGTLVNWILNLQPRVERPRSQAEILDLLVQDQAAAGNGSDTRYVSFAQFADARRPPEEIRIAGAVFKLVLNSLSRRPVIVNPVAVDREGSIWRFRLSDLGWSEQDWQRLISFDPYCLRSDAAAHLSLYQRLRTEAPVVRGDWFLVTALRPPLYNELLNLGDTLDEIARQQLGIDINENIARGNVQRLEITNSGVLQSTRVLERHAASAVGYLWLTYNRARDQSILRPPSNLNSYTAGTEAIWSLPNRLQGYALANADGKIVGEAPTVVVQDPRSKSGTVESTISCNGCHGLSGLIRPGMVTDIAGETVQRILAADADRYRRAILGYPLPGEDNIEWEDLVTLRGQYESKVALRQGAIELGTDQATARREVQSSSNSGALLPLTLADPLVARREWICRFRRIASEVRGASFCADTFTAVEVRDFRDFCDNL